MTEDQFRRLMLMLEAIRHSNLAVFEAVSKSASNYSAERSRVLASQALSDPEDEALIAEIEAEGEDVDEGIIDARDVIPDSGSKA